MEEKDKFKNQFIKFTIYHILVFACIFMVFGMFVFSMVVNITYNSVDKELYENEQRILQNDDSIKFDLPFIIGNDFFNGKIEEYSDSNLRNIIKSPKIILVLRNENKEIINEEDLGKIKNYESDFKLDEKKLDKVHEVKVGEKYNYRLLSFKIESSKENLNRYVQLLINVDSEKALINNYFEIIISAVLLGIFLSIIASYVLSKKTLKPIEENIGKQIEFVENASHELRTPLTIIQAKQELLLQEPNAKIIDKSEDIILTLNETKRLAKLTKDLMMLSRADKKTINLQREIVNIDNFIENLSKPYIEIAKMQEKNIILNLQYKNEINIDTNRIYQLMIILLDNAIKYTEKKDSIEIKTYSKDNKCIIEVKDTGIGVSDEGLKRIFERFYREDKARSRETGGSGLGLSIASFIVNAHGGIIKASHNTPKGTIFTIKLPK